MQARCSLVFLACTVFIGLNLLSEELLHIDDTSRQDGNDGGFTSLQAQPSAELYRGEYVFVVNGSLVLWQGTARVILGLRQTSALAVQMSSISITLVGAAAHGGGSQHGQDVNLHLAGVELAGAQQVAASGVAEPRGALAARLGASPCRLDAVFTLKGKDADLAGEVASANCGFSLRLAVASVDVQHVGRKAVRYSLWVNVLTVIQMRCFLSQMRYTDEGPSAAKLSLVGIAAQALMDAYDAFLHLSISASSRHVFNMFASVAMLKFVLFALLEVRYLLTIWRQRNRDIFAQGWDAVRQELSRVYSYFYAALIGGLVLIFSFIEHLDKMVLAAQVYWVPQILHDVRQGSRNALEPCFLVGISVTRCLALLYLWGCPRGVFDGDIYPKLSGAPSPWLCAAAVLLQVAQVAIMASQRILGPRWFVPWMCLPRMYNYRRPVEVAPGSECVICMAELDQEDGQQHAVTPCDHRFHQQCLERWMDVKMECPTCRAELPPMG